MTEPAPSRSRNAALNFATSLAFTGITLLGAIVSSRLIVRWVGTGRFGAYRTLTEWFGYLALLELGLGGAVGPLLSRALSSGDRPAIRATLSAAIRAYLRVTLVAVGVGLALVAVLPRIIPVPPSARADQAMLGALGRLVGGPVPIPLSIVPDLRLAGLLSMVGFLMLPLIPLRSLAEADQRGYQVNLLLIGQFVVITATSLVLCGFLPPWGISGQAASAALGAVLLNFGLARATMPKLPGTPGEILATRPEAAVWRGIWALSWPTLVLQFSGRINLQTDSIVLSRMVGVDAVTILYFSSRLPQMAQQQLANVGSACWAGLADLHHRGEHETFRRRLLELFQLVTVLGLASVGPIFAYSPHFLALWVGPGLDGGDLVAGAAAAVALIVPLVSLAGWCISGTGRVRMLTVPAMISAAINLASSVALAYLVGVAGPLLGTVATMLSFGLWYNARLLHRVFDVPYGGLARSVVVPLAWGLPYTAALWWVARSQPTLGWLGLAAQMGAGAVGSLAIAGAFVLSTDERAAWRHRIGSFLDRVRGFVSRQPENVRS
jgi:O-antigen/teichoic acid export membrane protein